MESVFDKLWRLGPAPFVLKAIVVAIVADLLLLAFILLRRTRRKRYFAKRDARVFEFRQKWDALISGQIPFESWRKKPFDRRIVEAIALDAFESAGPEESARLLKFLRASGLIEKRIYEARHHTGWRRLRALTALGRTRAPEGISALAEALRDGSEETRLAALRGLGSMASPRAGEEILTWVDEAGLVVPALPLQSALIQCCVERPRLLLPHIKDARGSLREVLGRVLGEVATPSLALDLLQFVEDDMAELRAAAARALAHSQSPGLTLDVLSELVRDRIWFVRLRAIVSLGQLSDRRAKPALLRGLTDSHRMVRLRAAEALVGIDTEMADTFAQVVATRDRYGLHAYLTAVENADLLGKLGSDLQQSTSIGPEEKERLQNVLRSGSLVVPDKPALENVAKNTVVLP
jgi:HEAT repeat protein